VLFYSGNDTAAKAEVAALIDRIGFVGIDLGSLAVGGKLAQFPGGGRTDILQSGRDVR
jgi:8-hydroxy-5-deazaflavin:NADPH oxidoreductase